MRFIERPGWVLIAELCARAVLFIGCFAGLTAFANVSAIELSNSVRWVTVFALVFFVITPMFEFRGHGED